MVVFMRQTTNSDNREDQMWARRAFTARNHTGLDTDHEFTVTVIRPYYEVSVLCSHG